MAAHASQNRRGPRKARRARLPKLFRLPQMQDWQFFNQARLKEIGEIEARELMRLKSLHLTADDPEVREKRGRLTCSLCRCASNCLYYLSLHVLPALWKVLHILPDDLRLERETLLREGFPKWHKSDMTAFIAASEKYGRKNIKAVTRAMNPRLRDSTSKYAQVFWVRTAFRRFCFHSFRDLAA